jgi:hypothetical protein
MLKRRRATAWRFVVRRVHTSGRKVCACAILRAELAAGVARSRVLLATIPRSSQTRGLQQPCPVVLQRSMGGGCAETDQIESALVEDYHWQTQSQGAYRSIFSIELLPRAARVRRPAHLVASSQALGASGRSQDRLQNQPASAKVHSLPNLAQRCCPSVHVGAPLQQRLWPASVSSVRPGAPALRDIHRRKRLPAAMAKASPIELGTPMLTPSIQS